MAFSIYLPPNYETSDQRYPVVYLLHGMGQSYMDLVKEGTAQFTADKLIKDSTIIPMIIVMPDGGNTFYINSAEGYQYGDYFLQELIPYIDATYKTRPTRDSRAISGISMGGYGAILHCLKHPDVFSVCAGLSSGVVTDEEMEYANDKFFDEFIAPIFGKAKGKDRLKLETWRNNGVVGLIKQGKPEDLKKVKWYFDIGDEDSLYKGNSAIHNLLSDKGVPHEFRMRDGNHNWAYWRSGLGEALAFVSLGFK